MKHTDTGVFASDIDPSPHVLAGAVAAGPTGHLAPDRQSQIQSPSRGVHIHRDAVRVLWIDDELRPGDGLLRLLAFEGILVEVAGSGADGLIKARTGAYDVILLDLKLPDMFGLTVLQRLMASHVRTPVIVASGYYLEPEIEVDARRLGAAAILHKPFLDAEILATNLRAILDNEHRGDGPVPPDPPFGIVAASPAMQDIVAWAQRVTHSKANVLVTGETGTGKELVARAIHDASPRRNGPFVPVNCGAIPDNLFESELFGHRKGAFSGASEHTAGLIEAAHGGTLFLDEVADIPLPMQVRLLRGLEDGRVRRVGETRERAVDVRVIAATNRSLQEDMARGRFRQDLYYRLSVMSCQIPAVRDRPEDIEPLICYWLPRLSQQQGKPTAAISSDAIATLRQHRWPGNIRELRNVLEHALCVADGNVLTERDVSAAISRGVAGANASARDTTRKKDRVETELEATHWNRTETARRLGIGRTTLWRWLRNRDTGNSDERS